MQGQVELRGNREEYKEDKNLAEYFMKNNIGYDKNEVERLGLEINKKIYGEEK